jgi:hypothetical protein
MKSSLMKLNPVSTFSGEGHLQVFTRRFPAEVTITDRNMHNLKGDRRKRKKGGEIHPSFFLLVGFQDTAVYFPNTSFKRSVVRAAGFFRIFFSSSPTM